MHRLVGDAGDLVRARGRAAEQRARKRPGLAEGGELLGGGLRIVDGELAAGARASKKPTSCACARAGPEAWKAAPSSGKRPASAMQTRNISCAPGEKRKVAKYRHAAQRHLTRSSGLLVVDDHPVRTHWVCITASKSCRLSGK